MRKNIRNYKQRISVSYSDGYFRLSKGILYWLADHRIEPRYCYITEGDRSIRINFDNENGDRLITTNEHAMYICVYAKHYNIECKRYPAEICEDYVEFKYA